jgi:hypothetical protein
MNESYLEYAKTIVPVQIRDDVTVRIGGLPRDLSPAEAEKIGRVVLAMVNPPGIGE